MRGDAGDEGGEKVGLAFRVDTVLAGGVAARFTRCLTLVEGTSEPGDFCCRSNTRRDRRGE